MQLLRKFGIANLGLIVPIGTYHFQADGAHVVTTELYISNNQDAWNPKTAAQISPLR